MRHFNTLNSLIIRTFCTLTLLLYVAKFQAQDSVYVYHNLPYATANRFEAPVLQDFDETLDYSTPCVICPQEPSPKDTLYGLHQSEACLVLSISCPCPLDQDTMLRPVVVFIHGGNYYGGTGEKPNYQLTELAQRGQFVGVTLNYRLGAFGYSYLPNGSCNFGLQDQLTALRWIEQHIARFGGNPKDITLIGQSAGAQSIVYCLADTTRQTPIQKALLFSAPMGLTSSKATGQRRFKALQKELHGQDIYTCPTDSLLQAQLRYMQKHPSAMPFAPIGLPQQPRYKVNWPSQMVVCAQQRDAGMFGMGCLEKGATRLAFTAPGKRYVRYLQKQGVQAQYELLTWAPPTAPFGATHCCDLPLFLGTAQNWVGIWFLGAVTEADLAAPRAQMQDRIIRFVYTGEW